MGVWVGVCVCLSVCLSLTLSASVVCWSVGLDAHVSATACLVMSSNADEGKVPVLFCRV